MTTYLKDLAESLGRYGGLSKQDLGLRVLDAQVVYVLSAEFLSSKDVEQTPHIKGSMTT